MKKFEEFAALIFPEPEELPAEELPALRERVARTIARLDEQEPEDQFCEEYAEWGDIHERFEDYLDDLDDLLEELGE